MIRTLSLLFLFIGIACQSDEVGPNDLFFKTWERQSGTYQGQAWPSNYGYDKYPLLVEFGRDGTLLYGTNKGRASCCAPYSYRFTANSLQFAYDNPKPDPICAVINCISSELTAGVSWTIETLTATDLIISTADQRIVFKAR